MVAAAATMGTGSDALNRNERALCFTWSTTSGPQQDAADAAEGLAEGAHDDGQLRPQVVLLEDAAAALAQRARAVRVVAHDDRVLELAAAAHSSWMVASSPSSE
jgi:hypothetical protein